MTSFVNSPLVVWMFLRLGGKGLLTQFILMNYKSVFRTAPATLGLLMTQMFEEQPWL
jgi:hypothetical protein